MNVTTIRAAFDTKLANISGLRHYAQVPDRIDCPAAVVGPPDIITREDMAGGVRMVFPVFVLIGPASGSVRAEKALDAYLDTAGASSVIVAVEAGGSLGGAVDSIMWLSTDGYGGAYEFGTNTYIGAQVNFEVYAS